MNERRYERMHEWMYERMNDAYMNICMNLWRIYELMYPSVILKIVLSYYIVFLIVVCMNVCMNACRYIFQGVNRIPLYPNDPDRQDEVDYTPFPQKLRIPGLNRTPTIYELFESNIDPMIRLGHKQGLQPSGWITHRS